MASSSELEKKLKGLAKREDDLKDSVVFIPTAEIKVLKPTERVFPAGELYSTRGGEETLVHLAAIRIEDWFVCIDIPTKKDTVPDSTSFSIDINQPYFNVPDYSKGGAIAAYKDKKRYVLETIEVVSDPRNRYIAWLIKHLY